MKDITELLIQVVVFATALIGLYKVARYSNDNVTKQSNGNSSQLLNYFRPLLFLIGVYGFKLIIPLFIYFFTLITNATTQLRVDKKEVPIVYQAFNENGLSFNDLSNEEKDIYLLYLTAINISKVSEKDKLLENDIKLSIDLKSYNIATLAVQNISNATKRDNLLDTVLETSVKEGSIDIAVNLLPIYSSSAKKEKAANIISTKIMNKYEKLKI